MRFYNDTLESQTSRDKIYVVTSHDEWDSWDVSYHKTKKGAYKWIMADRYELWNTFRYIGDYDFDYYISERFLDE